MPLEHGLGYLPDVPKPTDYSEAHKKVAELFAGTKLAAGAAPGNAGAVPAALPPSVDLRRWFPPIQDQGQLGSCTAHAAVGLLEYNEKRAHGTFVDASRLFLYKAERDLLDFPGDTGAYLRTAMEALALFGAPPERYWPYDGSEAAYNRLFNEEPPAFCYAFGASYQALTYFRHDPVGATAPTILSNIKTHLEAGIPCMFGFPVYDEYVNPLPGGLVDYPSANSKYYGGHANVIAGYDDNLVIGPSRGALLIRNSWGTEWGAAGYGWLSYAYVETGLANDFWSMMTAKWMDTHNFG